MDRSIPILITKVLVPRRRSDMLTRPRLLEQLSDLLDNRLIILSAAAGYGKTTLLIDFAHHTEWPFCWYAIDALDREPQRFAAHFLASLRQQFPEFGTRTAAVLDNMTQGELDIDSLVSVVVNDAIEHIHEHFVLVLDDYHNVDDAEPVAMFISRFIQAMDDNCHVIIASRKLISLPDLPLLVARGQVGGLSYEDLAFTAFEIQTLVLQNYLTKLTDDEARNAAQNVEGWITGLLMGTQIPRPNGQVRLGVGRPNNMGLYDFMAQQVLETQTPDMQDFLLRSSLLEEFDVGLCQEVIGEGLGVEQDWQMLTDALFQRNLFVLPVGEESIFLRYHHLFKEFLQSTILHTRPEEAALILNRLVEIYSSRGDWERAFATLQRMGGVDEVIRFVAKTGSELVARGRILTLQEWIESLPTEVVRSNPDLLSLQAVVAEKRGNPRLALELMDKALEMMDPTTEPRTVVLNLIRRSSFLRTLGDYSRALEDSDRAIGLTVNQPDRRDLLAEALRAKGASLFYMGNPKDGLEYQNQSLLVYQELKDKVSEAILLVDIGMMNTSIGNYIAAEHAYIRSLEYWQLEGNATWLANILNNLGDLQRLLGDYESAITNLEKAIEQARLTGHMRMEAYSFTSIGDLYADLEAYSQAVEAYGQARQMAIRIQHMFLEVYMDAKQAAILARQGEIVASQKMFENAWRAAIQHQSQYEMNLCRMERGCANVLQGELSRAITDLSLAAEYFSSSGFQVEALRAGIYLAVAGQLFEPGEQSQSYLVETLSRASGMETRKAILPSIRLLLPLMEPLQANVAVQPYLAFFTGEAIEFEKGMNQLKRKMRRQVTVVPFAPPKIFISALGRAQVRVNEHVITGAEWVSQVSRDLLYFTLAHQDGVTKESVGEVFWPGSSPAEIKLRFKNAIYRMRTAVGKDVVVFEDEIYRFNNLMDYEFDLESYYRELYRAERAADPKQKLQYYQQALRHYQGPYLPDADLGWFVGERNRLQQVHLNMLVSLSSVYLDENDFYNCLQICQLALNTDPCLEPAHRLAMRAFSASGNRAGLVRQYELCRQALKEELNTSPSEQTRGLYHSLLQ